MFSLLQLVGVLYLAITARAQAVPGCSVTSRALGTAPPMTISSCTLFYTPSMPPQIGPTSTVYATMMTTQFNVVNCNYCHISNVAENPMPTGPFTTKITSNYLLITQIACIPNTSALTRRHALPEATARPNALYIRGGKPPTFMPLVQRNGLLLPKLVDHVKRQAPTSATGNALILTGEASRLNEQLITVIYATSLINSGADLEEICLQLQSANAILDLAEVGLNATQAAAIVCSASLPDATLDSFNQTLIASAAAVLYGVQLAANFTGTTNTTRLCTELDLSLLPTLGVDVDAVQNFICIANSVNSSASVNASVSTTVPSLGTVTPSLSTNSSGGIQTWLGNITSAGSAGTAVTTPLGTGVSALGTGVSASGTGLYPTGNLTSIGANVGSGTGTAVPATAVVGSGTAAYGTPDMLASTGNTGPGLQINGTGNPFAGTGNPFAGTSVAGSEVALTATGVASAGYGTSTADSSPSPVGYGEGASERVPHGPTSTPRYYPKYY